MFRVQQSIHILGEDYLTIISCRHNRRSFVYCCIELFKFIPSNELISVLDFYHLLQLICPDIPLSLIQDSAYHGCSSTTISNTDQINSTNSTNNNTNTNNTNTNNNSSPVLYSFEELSSSLYFRFIFTEWLIIVENLFFENNMKSRRLSSTQTYSLSKLQQKLQEYSLTLPITTQQPSNITLQQLYSQWNVKNKHEITFDELIYTLLHNQQIKNETISYRPKQICPQQFYSELDHHIKSSINIEIQNETNIFRHLDYILSNVNNLSNSVNSGNVGVNIGSSNINNTNGNVGNNGNNGYNTNLIGGLNTNTNNSTNNNNGYDNLNNDGLKSNGTNIINTPSSSSGALLPGIK